MSMILDALQRADRERQQQDPDAPPPEEIPTPAATPITPPLPAQRRRLGWAIGGAAVIVVLGLTMVLLNRSGDDTDGTGTARPIASESVADTSREISEPTLEPPIKSDAPADDTADIARLYEASAGENESVAELYRKSQGSEEESRTVDTATAPQPADRDETTPSDDAEPEASPVANEPAQSPAQPAPETSEPTTEAADASAEDPAPADPEEPTLPSIRDLPWNLQQSLPSLNYQSHEFSEDGRSHVVINGKTRRAGDRITPELILERVVRDGAVLRYHGYEFKLQALSSWVNM